MTVGWGCEQLLMIFPRIENPSPIRYTRLWVGLVTVIVASFAVLGYFGGEFTARPRRSRSAWSRPTARCCSPGRTSRTVRTSGNRWAGQEVGTVWGHGAYVAPDWSADWLHREATWLLDHWAAGRARQVLRAD